MRRYERLTTPQLALLVRERLYTQKQIADLLQLTKQSVARRIESGDLPKPIGTLGRSEIWDRDEVLEYASRWKRLG